MNRMIVATVVLIVTISVFIISFAVLSEPVGYIIDSLKGAHDETGDEINGTLDLFPYFLGGAIVVGVLLMFVWYVAYGHKKEYERY